MNRLLRILLAPLFVVIGIGGVTDASSEAGVCSVLAQIDDADGKLDLRSASLCKESKDDVLDIRVKTFHRWAEDVLRGSTGNRLLIYFDVDDDRTADYRARIRSVDGALVAFIKGSGQTFEPLPVHRPSRRGIRLQIPGNSPPNPKGDAPSIRVESTFIASLQCDPASGSDACVSTLSWFPEGVFPTSTS